MPGRSSKRSFERSLARRKGLELGEKRRPVVVAETAGRAVVGLRRPADSAETRRRYVRRIQESIAGRRRNALKRETPARWQAVGMRCPASLQSSYAGTTFHSNKVRMKSGAPKGTRTPNLLIRSPFISLLFTIIYGSIQHSTTRVTRTYEELRSPRRVASCCR